MTSSTNHSFIASLKQDHVRILGHLEALRQGVEKLGPGAASGVVASVRETAATLLREIDRHSLKREEQGLFPALKEAIGPMGPIAVMLSEHRELDSKLPQLLEELGKGSPNVPRVQGLADFIVGLLPDHIQKEDFILYPMAEKCLSPAQMAQVAAKFQEIEAA